MLPGRNPVVLAKELASLDRLSGGRLLPAFGLGVADPHEQQAFGVARGDRAAWFDEALPLIRRLWLEDSVDHDGPRFHFEGTEGAPEAAPAAARRLARRPRSLRAAPSGTPGRRLAAVVHRARRTWPRAGPPSPRWPTQHGRSIDPEHYGVLLAYAMSEPRPEYLTLLAKRRPDLDPTELVPVGLPTLARRLEAFIEAGASKFVVVPFDEPPGEQMADHLAEVADALLPLQT